MALAERQPCEACANDKHRRALPPTAFGNLQDFLDALLRVHARAAQSSISFYGPSLLRYLAGRRPRTCCMPNASSIPKAHRARRRLQERCSTGVARA